MSTKKPKPPVVVDRNQRYSLAEAAATLRQSLAQLYRDMAAEPPRLNVVREGRRTYVRGDELIRRATGESAAS